MDRRHPIPSNRRPESLPLLRRASPKSEISNQLSQTQKHDCHFQHAADRYSGTCVSTVDSRLPHYSSLVFQRRSAGLRLGPFPTESSHVHLLDSFRHLRLRVSQKRYLFRVGPSQCGFPNQVQPTNRSPDFGVLRKLLRDQIPFA